MIKKYIGLLFELIKIKISLPVAFLGFIGFSLFRKETSWEALLLAFGVLILAGAASACNQVMEVAYDLKMERTRRRPIPSEQISIVQAIAIVVILAACGLYILQSFNHVAFIVGMVTFIWYIGVYTMLKRVSAFAVIPGSLTGALPPMIGWAAAGGSIYDTPIIYIALFIFIWQIPHFWLLTLLYSKDYKKANFPSLADYFNDNQIRKWTFVWIIFGLLFSAMSLLWFHSIYYRMIHLLLIAGVGYLSYSYLLLKPSLRNYKKLFHIINSLMVLLLLLQMLFV